MRSADRTARSASSSCATGAPKTAMTASPMNFSTVPPKRSMSALTRSWYGRSVARTSSGSARSERFVKPTRSTKSTETTLRSSPAGAAAAERLPAGEAEACPLGVLLAAGGADDHAGIFAAGRDRVYAAGGRSGGSSSAGGSSSSASRRWSTLRERTPMRRPSSSTTGTRSASSSSRNRNASSSGTSGPIV